MCLLQEIAQDQESMDSIQHSYADVDSSPPKDAVSVKSLESLHYEVPDNEEPYWEPASAEDELRAQLSDCGHKMMNISEDSIRYVDVHYITQYSL